MVELNNLCIFCLREPAGSQEEEESVLRLIFGSNHGRNGSGFRAFFWRMLVGVGGSENGDGTGAVTGTGREVCFDCLQTLREIQRLHSSLETVQMLILEEIGKVQKRVKEANAVLKYDDSKKRDLEVLKEFQERVISHSRQVCRVPTVFLGSVKNQIKALTTANKIETNKRTDTKLTSISTKSLSPSRELKMESSVIADDFPSGRKRRLLLPIKKEVPGASTNETELKDNFFSEQDVLKVDDENDGDRSEQVDEDEPVVPDEDEEYAPPVKRRVGRPRKDDALLKRPRGRPSVKLKTKRTPAASPRIGTEQIGSIKIPPKEKAKRSGKSKEEGTTNKKHHRLYRCNVCGHVFFKNHSFLKHQQYHKDNGESYEHGERIECLVCKENVHVSDYYEHLHRHEGRTTDDLKEENLLFKCTVKDCSRKFKIEENLKIHLEIDHTEIMERTFMIIRKCDICSICYDTSHDLMDHMRKVHKSDLESQFRQLLSCPVKNCGFVCTQNETMILHSHNHISLEQQICFICSKTVSNRSELISHFKLDHQLDTSASCTIDGCNEHFEDPYFYKVHIRKEHKRKEIFICNFCGTASFFPSTFLAHFRRHKKLDRRGFQCPDCPEKFRNGDALYRHRVNFHNAPKIPCEICGREYMTPYALKHHKREHNKEGYHCTVCDRYYNNKNNFMEHMSSHSSDRPFVCEICGTSLKTMRSLIHHRKCHDKKFECEICGRKFAKKLYKKTHMKMHTNETLVCPFCGYEFHNQKSLNGHVKAYHTGENPLPLYPPQKIRKAQSRWKDGEGNLVYAKTGPKNEPA